MRRRGPSADALALAAAVLLAALAAPGVSLAQAPALETAVKATYLYKFAAFVEWPAAAFDSPTAPAQLCIAGDDPFGPVLAQAVRGQTIGDHPIALVHLDRVDKAARCHILFVAPSRGQSMAEALDKVRGEPILTVTDAASNPAGRGLIDFVLKDNRVRFRIDARGAGQAGLTVSSKLLSLAVAP